MSFCCQICTSPFSTDHPDTDKRPMLLSCGHTFCATCLRDNSARVQNDPQLSENRCFVCQEPIRSMSLNYQMKEILKVSNHKYDQSKGRFFVIGSVEGEEVSKPIKAEKVLKKKLEEMKEAQNQLRQTEIDLQNWSPPDISLDSDAEEYYEYLSSQLKNSLATFSEKIQGLIADLTNINQKTEEKVKEILEKGQKILQRPSFNEYSVQMTTANQNLQNKYLEIITTFERNDLEVYTANSYLNRYKELRDHMLPEYQELFEGLKSKKESLRGLFDTGLSDTGLSDTGLSHTGLFFMRLKQDWLLFKNKTQEEDLINHMHVDLQPRENFQRIPVSLNSS